MTADEKTALARLLDVAGAVVRGGYVEAFADYRFEDSPEPEAPPPGGGRGICSDDSFEKLEADIRGCTACRLSQERKNAVPGEGVRNPAVMVIGEGPGADEDESGRPFVGKAGQLLDKMLAAIGLSREENCFIANVVKCRPPGNRDPYPDETAACAPFLERQARLLNPSFALLAGRIACQSLLGTKESIGRIRGRVGRLEAAGLDVPFVATYHPSALLRNDEYKRPAWEDLKLLRSALEDSGFSGTE